MKEPCRSCPEQAKDFGGCHCQAFLLTGDMHNTDPACSLSPDRQRVYDAIFSAGQDAVSANAKPLVFRNPKTSKAYSS
jgi:pyrroloquinoline quinone biosynthesis protein E